METQNCMTNLTMWYCYCTSFWFAIQTNFRLKIDGNDDTTGPTLTPATRSPFCTLWLCDLDLWTLDVIFIDGRIQVRYRKGPHMQIAEQYAQTNTNTNRSPDPNRYRRRCPDPNARIQKFIHYMAIAALCDSGLSPMGEVSWWTPRVKFGDYLSHCYTIAWDRLSNQFFLICVCMYVCMYVCM